MRQVLQIDLEYYEILLDKWTEVGDLNFKEVH